jgi:hypothetical protein
LNDFIELLTDLFLLRMRIGWDSVFSSNCWKIAGDVVAFFVDNCGEGVDQFVNSILQSGFGTGGEASEIAILQRVLQVPPPPGG